MRSHHQSGFLRKQWTGERLEPRLPFSGDFAGVFAEQTALLADLNTQPAPRQV